MTVLRLTLELDGEPRAHVLRGYVRAVVPQPGAHVLPVGRRLALSIRMVLPVLEDDIVRRHDQIGAGRPGDLVEPQLRDLGGLLSAEVVHAPVPGEARDHVAVADDCAAGTGD